MGGYSYDRDVYGSSSYGSSWGSSSYSQSALSASSLDSTMNPKGKILKSYTKNPVIVMLDVTGSNINFARLVYDKMPMFYGQIEQQNYLDDFEILFCAIGDAYTDCYPLQVGEFAKGIELDSWLEKLVLEGCGGGQGKESYELAAYFLLKHVEFERGAEPIIFFIGDEAPYSRVNETQVEELIGEHPQEDGIEPFEPLRRKVNDNVYMLLNKYNGGEFDDKITTAWQSVLAPEHTVKINEEKAIVDLMLGIISMVSTSRTLDTYRLDMGNRNQTQKRIEGVTESLKKLSNTLSIVKVKGEIKKDSGGRRSQNRGKRL